ncbi:MAG TPA: hypothetical protein ENK16_04285, partial [Chromatiales bacterium]|nr:hypothetical protein [Chromatiales bacterium]
MTTAKGSKHIGITMHEVFAHLPDEPCDTLSHDWHAYMRFALPEAKWTPIPNLGRETVINYLTDHDIDGLILSGGNDIGDNCRRDETEQALLEHCLERNLPVLGISRGMEQIQVHLGGELTRIDSRVHVNTTHPIRAQNGPDGIGWCGIRTVNSDHEYGIPFDALHPSLYSLATTNDNWVEAALMRDRPVGGLMWHPEREKTFNLRDKA